MSPQFDTLKSKELLTSPLNLDIPRLFVAATRQNDGKTTTCLGLFAALREKYQNVGYIKPIGQRFIDIEGLLIDEDSYLLNRIFDVNVPIEAMSPVAIDGTFTRRFLDDPEGIKPILVDRIVRAFDRASYGMEAVIIEGSGHAGVGAICDLSNAEVAKLLGAKAIIVAGGGIGGPVDEIALNKSLFDRHGVEVVGAIINKVLPNKIDLIDKYTRKGLERLGIPLLGIIPVQEQLAAPNLSQIVEILKGRWINGREHGGNQRIHQVIVGAMAARGILDHFKPGVLIITPGDREDVLISAIAANAVSGGKHQLSGIVLTRDSLPHPKILDMLSKTDIPIVVTPKESYAVASKIHSMTVKTQPQDEDKIPIIKKLVSENVDLDKIIPGFSSPRPL